MADASTSGGGRRLDVLLVAAAVVVVALAGYGLATRHGVALWADSVTYLEGAQILADEPTAVSSLAERGEVGRYGHYPPLYSVALAVPGWLGVDLLDGARVVNALLLVATLGGLGVLVGRRTSAFGGVAAAAALAVTGGFVVRGFAWLLSESLFLCLVVWALVVFDRALDLTGGRHTRWLIGAALLVGAATLTRLIGFGVAGGLAVALLAYGSPGRRVRSTITLLVVSVAVALPWFVSGRVGAGDVGDRQLSFHPPGWFELRRFGRATGGVLAGPLGDVVWLAALGVVLAAMVWAVRFVRRTARDQDVAPADRLTGTLLIVSGAYLAALVVSRTLLDPNIPLDERLLVPLVPATVAVATLQVVSRWSGLTGPVPRGALIAGLALVLAAGMARTTVVTVDAWSDGLGYEGPTWSDSETMAYVAGLPEGRLVVSNGPDAVWLRSGRVVDVMPSRHWPGGPAGTATRVEREGAVVVWFDDINRTYLTTPGELVAEGLTVVRRFDDGVILAG